MWTDLGVLTPSIIVCAAFVTGVVYMLRNEMGPKRREHGGDDDPSPGISSSVTFSSAEHDEASVTSEHEDAQDRSGGSLT